MLLVKFHSSMSTASPVSFDSSRVSEIKSLDRHTDRRTTSDLIGVSFFPFEERSSKNDHVD